MILLVFSFIKTNERKNPPRKKKTSTESKPASINSKNGY